MAAIEGMMKICRFVDWLSARTETEGVSERKWEDGSMEVSNDDVAGASSGDLPLAHPLPTLSHAYDWAGIRRPQRQNVLPIVQCARVPTPRHFRKGPRVLANSLAFGLFSSSSRDVTKICALPLTSVITSQLYSRYVKTTPIDFHLR